MIAINGFLTALECTKFVFRAGALPRTPLGELATLPRLLAGLRAPTSKGRKGKEKNMDREGRKKGRGGSDGYKRDRGKKGKRRGQKSI